MTLRATVRLFALIAFGASITGCHQRSTDKTVNDTLWDNGELRMIVNTRHYIAPILNFHGSGTMTKQEWELVTIPFPDQSGRSTQKREFLQMGGNYEHSFSSIQGSDLLIHQVIPNMISRQLFLYLVLFPYITSSSYVVASNFTAEVWSTNGSVGKWTLPIERKEGKFVDAELIDGKVLLMWRKLLSNGAEDAVELFDTQGQTVHSGKISAFTLSPLWSPKRHEVLFPYYEAAGRDRKLPPTFYLWNYSSNIVQRISLKR